MSYRWIQTDYGIAPIAIPEPYDNDIAELIKLEESLVPEMTAQEIAEWSEWLERVYAERTHEQAMYDNGWLDEWC